MRPTIYPRTEQIARTIRRRNWFLRLATIANLGLWASLAWALEYYHDAWAPICLIALVIVAIGFWLASRRTDTFTSSVRNMSPVQLSALVALTLGIGLFHRPPVASNAGLVAVVITVMVGWFSALVWMDLPRIVLPGFCKSCGYNLQGLTGFTCPECGHEFDPDEGKP